MSPVDPADLLLASEAAVGLLWTGRVGGEPWATSVVVLVPRSLRRAVTVGILRVRSGPDR